MIDLSRRRYQSGSLRKDGSYWRARWREDVILPTGVPPKKGDKPLPDGTILRRINHNQIIGTTRDFETKSLAKRELERILTPINAPTYKPVKVETFEGFAVRWQKTVMIHHKPSNQHGERSVIKNHLIPAFGRLAWRDITTELLQAWVSRQTDKPNSVRNRMTVLREMWNSAKAWGYIQANPFDGLVMPTVKRGGSYFFSIEESLAILEAIPPGWQRTACRILALTGIRPGELAGLRREDVQGCVLRVVQSVFNGKVQTPKTEDSIRSCAIPQYLADEIAEHIRTTPAYTSGLLFATSTGRPMCMKNFLKTTLNPALEKTGIRAKVQAMGKKLGSYPFRHGNITEMGRRGVPLKTIQKRVGHSAGTDVTQRIYMHSVDSDDFAAADMLGELLAPRHNEVIQ